jgi:hypothetical protein
MSHYPIAGKLEHKESIMANFKLVGLLVTALMVAWPIMDGCWQGFLSNADAHWRKDAILHSLPIGFTICLFAVPLIVQRLKPSSR